MNTKTINKLPEAYATIAAINKLPEAYATIAAR
jgi:hypothetical protein